MIITFPNCPKNVLISSSLISVVSPPTKILPWRAFAFFGSTFLLLMMCSATTVTLSIESAAAYTMNAKPRERPVCGSVFTFMLSISPYCPKCSRNSSANKNDFFLLVIVWRVNISASRIGTHFLWFPNLVHQRIIFWNNEKNGVKNWFPCSVWYYKYTNVV